MLYDQPFLDEIRGNTLVLGVDHETIALRTLARQAQEQGAAVTVITTPETREDWAAPGLGPLSVASTPEEITVAVKDLAGWLDDTSSRDQQIVLVVSDLESIPESHKIVRRFFLQKPRWLRHVIVGTRRWPLPGILEGHSRAFIARIVTGQNMDVLRNVVGFDTPAPPCWDDWSVQAWPGGAVKTIDTPNVVYPRPGEVY